MFRLNTLVVCLLTAAMLAQAERQFKSQAEYDAYNNVTKDLAANNPQKALTDLEAWEQKFPNSDYKDDRTAMNVQALAASNQPAKALDAAAELMLKDLGSALSGPAQQIKLLYVLAQAIQKVPDPTPFQLTLGAQAARQLAAYDKAPQGVTPEAWAQARKDMQGAANAALLYTDLIPSAQAMNRKDCETAETDARKAIGDFPASAQAAWSLGSALLCLQKTHPEKAPTAIYEFARAASLDPQSAMVDPKWQQSTAEPYLEKIYNQYHGTDADGLKQLKALAITSPLPPADFQLKSTGVLAAEKEADFEKANPQLALWMKIKAALTAPNGSDYFDSELKSSAVPALAGIVVEAKPACHPKELLVAIKTPNQESPVGEILLKLDRPLNGKPEVPADIQFEGVPSAFSPTPFLLTMDTEAAKVTGLKDSPCVVGRGASR
jgi:hypothetical protein